MDPPLPACVDGIKKDVAAMNFDCEPEPDEDEDFLEVRRCFRASVGQ